MYRVFATLLVSGLLIPTAQAAEWSLTGSLNPSAEYNDNVQMQDDEQGSMHYAITPTAMVARALENSKTSVSVGYKVNRYTSIDNLDTENPFVRFNSSYSTERSQYGLAASYVESTTRSDAEEDTGDFTTQSILTTESISPSYRYQLSERDSLSLSGSYSKREYSTSDFSDNESISVTTGWQRQFSERLNGGLNFSVSNYQSDGATLSTDNDNYNLSVSFGYELSETWHIGGRVGIRRLESEQRDNFGFTDSNSSSGSTFNVNARRVYELDTLGIDLSRALSPSSSGDVNEQDRISLSWSRKLSERLSTSVTASYQESTSATDGADNKRENINFSPSIRWQFAPNIGVNVAYRYREQKRDSGTVDSNAISATLNYNWDGIRASR